MPVRVMMKKAIAVICVSMAAIIVLDGAVPGTGVAGPVGETSPPELKETPRHILVFHAGLLGLDRILDGLQKTCIKADLIRINVLEPQQVKVTEEDRNLILAVGDYAMGIAIGYNLRRINEKIEPFPIVYVYVEYPPPKLPYITGVCQNKDIETRLRIIGETFPGKRLGAFFGLSMTDKDMDETLAAAKKTGVNLISQRLTRLLSDKALFEEFTNLMEFADVYWELLNPLLMDRSDLMYDFYRYAKEKGKPVVTFHDMLVGTGSMETKGLMAINDDFDVVGNQAGDMVTKIFTGKRPVDIPRETAASGVITVNLFEAKYFKLTLPANVAPEGWKIRYFRPEKWSVKPPK